MNENARTVAVRIEGRVQGVNYRNFAVTAARGLGITGWVVNRDDGSVEAALHGPGQALADMIAIMRKGPPDGDVETIDARSTDRGAADEPPPGAYRF